MSNSAHSYRWPAHVGTSRGRRTYTKLIGGVRVVTLERLERLLRGRSLEEMSRKVQVEAKVR